MPSDRNETLNEVLIALNRSLLMYVQEAWPWTSKEGDAERVEIMSMADRRQENVASIVELLSSRGAAVEFGVYPVEFTDLHYIALDYLLTLLLESEQQAVDAVAKGARELATSDPEGAHLLETILTSEKDTVSRLQALAKAHAAVSAGK
jgi:hypothetical protein